MPPKLKGLDHLAMKVRDLDKSLHFYIDLLGFQINDGRKIVPWTGRSNRHISCTNKHHTINLFEFRPKDDSVDLPKSHSQDNDEYGLMHFAFEVANKGIFDEWVKYLHSLSEIKIIRGPTLHSATHPEGDGTPGENRSIYIEDPDGNVVEIMCDMMRIGKNGEVDKNWHEERIVRDGYDPNKVPLPKTHNYLD
ncbi:MAG: VOC family protein [Nitrospinota bacterium]|nr:VOC family protein [Nitrospinota bacterium]